jgi:hypothetical protein
MSLGDLDDGNLARRLKKLPAEQAKPAETDAAGARDKLFAFVGKAIEQNKAKILPMLKEKGGEVSMAALRDDRIVEKLALVLYGRLPLLVRLALREQVFVKFMLANRSRILEKFVVDPTRKL